MKTLKWALALSVAVIIVGGVLSAWQLIEAHRDNAGLSMRVRELEGRNLALIATLQVTPTPTTTPISTPTNTATPTATATSTSTTTFTPVPTYTPYPTPTMGPDPEQQFFDGIDAMCRGANGILLEMLFMMPFDCHRIVTEGRDLGWYDDGDFHKTATPMPMRPSATPEPSSFGFES